MASYLKFCGCRWCRAGMRARCNGHMIKRTARRFRRQAKVALKMGKEPAVKISVPYTD